MSRMSIEEKFKKLDMSILDKKVTINQVKNVLGKDYLNLEDFAILLSEKAKICLEEMAKRAHEESVRNFGKTIQLYTPLYLGNHCVNKCIYCAFNSEHSIKRKTLELDEIKAECEKIARSGLQDILLLTGESRKHTGLNYIKQAVKVAKEYFSSVSVEIYPLEELEYKDLIQAGVSGLTIYQETYCESSYKELHLKGPKTNYQHRLNTPERGAKAGMYAINIGVLLGLSNIKNDVYKLAAHLTYLMHVYPGVEWGLSLPRIQKIENAVFESIEITDKQYLQILLAFRLCFPRISINLSTRENSILRNHLLSLGITKMSAGVKTSVGESKKGDGSTAQFEISDTRSVEEISNMITCAGYQIIYKDWVSI
ncbi:MAG: 2-iminoacetate synthase ThiH [Alkaliphilus sp.]|nr:2-iminoacetate synthase ThiH [bacterium AH-315-K05]MBN4069677.1 2-iminoacetate synthase ThiH [bacterium AH-315-G05]PHS35597.1 MAG: 2-iminoacetate synthase ThiH [Alkaliphilus sp.]